MPLSGEYLASSAQWVRDQVDLYERSGGTEGTTLLDTGLPVVIVTSIGAVSGKLRKNPVMRVEHDGKYLAVASKGGADDHPAWYANLLADPRVELQDGTRKWDALAREIDGTERDAWWQRAVAAFPQYAEYEKKTSRRIPVFLIEPTAEIPLR
jgi:deazaflavin-dependent oxidoreductase (nitroreductase family)